MAPSINDREFEETLTLREAFEIFRRFLEQFNSRGARETDLLASWLELQPDGGTVDPAQLDDFLESARAVLAGDANGLIQSGAASQPDSPPAPASLQGISHITFIVRDLDRMAAFLCEGLGAQEVHDSAGHNYSLSREKFFVLGGVWLAAMEGDPPRERSYQHVAFAVSEADLSTYQARLQGLGVEVRPPRPRVDGEGQSLYFYDFDNHLFELHTGTLEQRLKRYRGEH